MHWAYYLTFALLAIYFAFLLYRHYKRKKEGRPSGCDCSGRGKMLVASYRAMKKKEEKAACSCCSESKEQGK